MSFFFGGSDSVAPVLLKHLRSLLVCPDSILMCNMPGLNLSPFGEHEGDDVVDDGGV